MINNSMFYLGQCGYDKLLLHRTKYIVAVVFSVYYARIIIAFYLHKNTRQKHKLRVWILSAVHIYIFYVYLYDVWKMK